MDTNGHGTQVAGVIAADGQVMGIAPKAKILALQSFRRWRRSII